MKPPVNAYSIGHKLRSVRAIICAGYPNGRGLIALPTLQRNATVSSSEIIYADEVAALLRRSLDTIRYWDRIGKVLPPSHKLGRRKYWRRSEIESLITK